MKFYFRQLIYNWRLTGFVGKNADWFLGYSSITKLHNISGEAFGACLNLNFIEEHEVVLE